MTILRRAALILAVVAACAGAAAAAEIPASGIFLVAKRGIRDPNFRETVVLVTQQRRGGPFGVIINRPLRFRLSELFPGYPALKNRQDVIYFGGPVERDGLVFLVRSGKPLPRATHVLKDVYLTGSPEAVDALLKRSDPTAGLRIYAGYAGWTAGQLQNEIDRGDWYVMPADVETVFEPDATKIWPELSTRAAMHPVNIVAPPAGARQSSSGL